MLRIFEKILYERCEFKGVCKYYSKDSKTCNRDPGPYCGQWRFLKLKKTVISKFKRLSNLIKKSKRRWYRKLANYFYTQYERYSDKHIKINRKIENVEALAYNVKK